MVDEMPDDKALQEIALKLREEIFNEPIPADIEEQLRNLEVKEPADPWPM